jgi:hypothetical protein
MSFPTQKGKRIAAARVARCLPLALLLLAVASQVRAGPVVASPVAPAGPALHVDYIGPTSHGLNVSFLGDLSPALSVKLPTMPAGVSGYIARDLQPTSATWVASQASGISGTRFGGFVQDSTGNGAHAAVWSGGITTPTDIHPTNGLYDNSRILNVGGSQYVGFGYYNQGVSTKGDHALLWTGMSAGSVVDLNPTGWKSSYAYAATAAHQAGYGYITTQNLGIQPHALMWSGSAATVVDLNPAGDIFSYAFGADGNTEVGMGLSASGQLHALAWNSSAASAIDIHPQLNSLLDSRAVTVYGTRAGGYGTDASTSFPHAILWKSLDSASAVDLNPPGFAGSQITALSASVEVGVGQLPGGNYTHALLWLDTPGAFTDLNRYLPSRFVSSEADAIDANGNIVGWAQDGLTGYFHAVEWIPLVSSNGPAAAGAFGISISAADLPEPGVGVMVIAFGIMGLGRRSKREGELRPNR